MKHLSAPTTKNFFVVGVPPIKSSHFMGGKSFFPGRKNDLGGDALTRWRAENFRDFTSPICHRRNGDEPCRRLRHHVQITEDRLLLDQNYWMTIRTRTCSACLKRFRTSFLQIVGLGLGCGSVVGVGVGCGREVPVSPRSKGKIAHKKWT